MSFLPVTNLSAASPLPAAYYSDRATPDDSFDFWALWNNAGREQSAEKSQDPDKNVDLTIYNIGVISQWSTLTRHLKKESNAGLDLTASPLYGNPIDAQLQQHYAAAMDALLTHNCSAIPAPKKCDKALSRLSVNIMDWSKAYLKLFRQVQTEGKVLNRSDYVLLTGFTYVCSAVKNECTSIPNVQDYHSLSPISPSMKLLKAMDATTRAIRPEIFGELLAWEYSLRGMFEYLDNQEGKIDEEVFRFQYAYVSAVETIKKQVLGNSPHLSCSRPSPDQFGNLFLPYQIALKPFVLDELLEQGGQLFLM